MEKNDIDNVGNKLDNINEAIHRLIDNLNISRGYTEDFSMISPINSFSESLIHFQDNFSEISPCSSQDSQNLLSKVHELLVENDRLHMQVEDLTQQIQRNTDPSFEIPITKETMQALNKDTEKFIRESANQVTLRIKKDSFIFESSTKPEKIIYFTGEITSKYFNMLERERKQKEEMELGVQVIQKKAELEAKIVALAKKQQKTMELEEDLGSKQQAFEMMKLEYFNKLQELESSSKMYCESPVKSKRTCSCSDQTDSSYFVEPVSFNSSVTKMLDSIEKVVKQQKKESICEESMFKDVTVQYHHNKKVFNNNLLAIGRFTNKEIHILKFFKEQSKFYDEKFKELIEYEKYLQETWVDIYGNEKTVSAIHKASQQNFNLSKQLKRERELLDQKTMRLEHIKQLIDQENKRLEFHRKKILNERQVLLSQQSDIELALEKIMNFKI